MAACKEILSFSSLLSSSSSSEFPFSNRSRFLKGNLRVRQATPATRIGRCRSSFHTPPAKSTPRSPPEKTERNQLTLRASVTIKKKIKEEIRDAVTHHLDNFSDMIGLNVILQLISEETNSNGKSPKKSREAALKDWTAKMNRKRDRVICTAHFIVDKNFGVPGAITVLNRHQSEFFIESVVIEGFSSEPVHFLCNSWIQPSKNSDDRRVFFSNKPYLPSETPPGLVELRKEELEELRGDGAGVRKMSERIYDYDVYNDLGNPDKSPELSRPVLGGDKIPYPRRCRTGRPPTDADLKSESRAERPNPVYVPRDEAFEELKQGSFLGGRLRAVLHTLVPSIMASISSENADFSSFHELEGLYKEGLLLKMGLQDHLLRKIPIVRQIQDSSQGLLRYDTPSILSKDKFAWLRDDEFARQALAGVNPVNIERVLTFPPVSKLHPTVYGQLESALREEHIAPHLDGLTVQQALENKKLFMLDYHDVYLPFVGKINAMGNRNAYATRTIFFLSDSGTIKPIAIELSLPSSRRVLTPPVNATTYWLWHLAKAHVNANDAGVHQLVNHWLRTHASVEPFVIATHRQLSTMHPIFKLLSPHLRYTLEINALARQNLVNADGVIESCFTPGSLCMEMSAAYYRDFWRFDLESLPADLLRRGVAEVDSSEPHGIRLLIEDYPYANDGLLLWSTIRNWVSSYVAAYYPTPEVVQFDEEIQKWYWEAVNVGHGDKRKEEWWPELNSPENLVSVLTTIIWLSSAQHAALNFGQYPMGGYVPNRSPMLRRLLPEEEEPEFEEFMENPVKFFLSAMPSKLQATKFMAVVDTLSTHSPDEEYIGERHRPEIWTADERMVEGFYEFAAAIGRIEKQIEGRNKDRQLKNRCGAGVLPYELLLPSSPPGVTGRGVPNSISI